MAADEDLKELFAGSIFALLMGYFLLKFFEVFPTGELGNGQFGGAYWIISLIPWLLFGFGIAMFLTIIKEVVGP